MLELLLSFGLLAAALLALASVFASGLALQKSSDVLVAACEVARATLESIKSRGTAQIPAGSHTYDGRVPTPYDPDTGFPPPPYPQAQQDGRNFPILVNVSERGTLRRVQVSVFTPRGQVDLETYLSP